MRRMPCVVLWNSPAGVVVRVGDPLVDEYRAGEPHEGRDGATVVTLRN